MAFLIIDSSINSIETFTAGVKVPYVVVDKLSTTSEIDLFIATNITSKGYTTVGLVFENTANVLTILDDENLFVTGPLWSHLVSALKSVGIEHIDLVTCYINDDAIKTNIANLESEHGIDIRYSLDATGAVEGSVPVNWIMESDSVNIEPIYFNSNISSYTHILGQVGSPIWFPYYITTDDQHYGGVPDNGSGIFNSLPYRMGGNHFTSSATHTYHIYQMNGSGFVEITSGQRRSALLRNDGKVYTIGNQGGAGSDATPIQINIDNVIQTAAGSSSLFFLRNDGKIYAFGSQSSAEVGEFGKGYAFNTGTVSAPLLIVDTPDDKPIRIIGAPLYTFYLTESGKLYVAGGGTGENAGWFEFSSTTNNAWTFTRVFGPTYHRTGLRFYSTTDAGYVDPITTPYITEFAFTPLMHCLIVLSNGTVYAYGKNAHGALGITTGFGSWGVVDGQVPDISNAKKVACGAAGAHYGGHSAVLLENGNLVTFGNNDWGQLGHSGYTKTVTPTQVPDLSNIVSVVCSYSSIMAIDKNGDFYCGGAAQDLGNSPGITKRTLFGGKKFKNIMNSSINGIIDMGYSILSSNPPTNTSQVATLVNLYNSPSAIPRESIQRVVHDYLMDNSLNYVSLNRTVADISFITNKIYDSSLITSVRHVIPKEDNGQVTILPNDFSATNVLYIDTAIGRTLELDYEGNTYNIQITSTGFIDLSSSITYALGDGYPIGSNTLYLQALDSLGFVGGGLVCFLGNAPVLTPSGYCRMDSLRVGDYVKTADGRSVKIQHIKKMITGPSKSTNPYIIPKGMYGAREKVLISPRHRILVNGVGMVEARNLNLQQFNMSDKFAYYNVELPNWTTDNLVVGGITAESLCPERAVRSVIACNNMYKSVISQAIDYLKTNYPSMTNDEIVKTLGSVSVTKDGKLRVSVKTKTA